MSAGYAETVPLPYMRSNPFSPRPIEASDADLLIGREAIVENLGHHLRFGSPRMLILQGERGSGRTSILHVLANYTPNSYPFTFYPDGDPSKVLLNEIYCRIVGYDVPPSMNNLIEELVTKLEGTNTDLPLISFDFPGISGVELARVFERMTPVLSRMRALVVISLTPAQLSVWPEDLRAEFDITDGLTDFNHDQIRSLINSRIRTVSNEKWAIGDDFIDEALSQTGGRLNPLMRHLRDTIDTAKGAKKVIQKQSRPPVKIDITDAKARLPPSLSMESLDDREEVLVSDTVPETKSEELEDMGGDLSDGDYDNVTEIVEDFELPPLDVPEIEDPDMDEALGRGVALQMEPGSEPPPSTSGFGGLASRHRAVSAEIGLDDALRTNMVGPMGAKPDVNLRFPDSNPIIESEESDLWASDTLPEPIEELPSPSTSDIGEPASISNSNLGNRILSNQSSDNSTPPLDFQKATSLSDAEITIVEASMEREVSPSDSALQAYLSVGRPRLSQIFNTLHKAGILSVRKTGRTRLFRISEPARSHFTDNHMEA
ncbi:MAG: hypothetical protein VX906_05815 [Candidatus Thermoplasmatota archaeon]|nr:hypothetical protein [Candidatus Thermoplasmatota archaeon]